MIEATVLSGRPALSTGRQSGSRCEPFLDESSRSRCWRLASSSSMVGTRTTLQTSWSPLPWAARIRSSPCASSRSVLARLARRFTKMLVGSTTWLITPCSIRRRCRQKPSRPASGLHRPIYRRLLQYQKAPSSLDRRTPDEAYFPALQPTPVEHNHGKAAANRLFKQTEPALGASDDLFYAAFNWCCKRRFWMVARLILSRSSRNGLSAAEVNVGRREITVALVITAMVVVIDAGVDPGFEVAG
jgi:hypothetical protein